MSPPLHGLAPTVQDPACDSLFRHVNRNLKQTAQGKRPAGQRNKVLVDGDKAGCLAMI